MMSLTSCRDYVRQLVQKALSDDSWFANGEIPHWVKTSLKQCTCNCICEKYDPEVHLATEAPAMTSNAADFYCFSPKTYVIYGSRSLTYKLHEIRPCPKTSLCYKASQI